MPPFNYFTEFSDINFSKNSKFSSKIMTVGKSGGRFYLLAAHSHRKVSRS